MRSILFAVVFLAAAAAHAETADAGKFCEKGFDTLDAIRSSDTPWKDFRDYFKTYGAKCDDGYFAEGTSELVMHLLAEWKDFAGLKAQCRDKKFFAYVLKNINGTGSDDDLKAIQTHSSACPRPDQALCKRIGQAAKGATQK